MIIERNATKDFEQYAKLCFIVNSTSCLYQILSVRYVSVRGLPSFSSVKERTVIIPSALFSCLLRCGLFSLIGSLSLSLL